MVKDFTLTAKGHKTIGSLCKFLDDHVNDKYSNKYQIKHIVVNGNNTTQSSKKIISNNPITDIHIIVDINK